MPLDVCLVLVVEHYTSHSLHDLAGVPNSCINYCFMAYWAHFCVCASELTKLEAMMRGLLHA